MSLIKRNLQGVTGVIAAIGQGQHPANAGGAKPRLVRLVAVSKTRTAEEIREAFACGQRAFGENYVQEGVAKIEQLRDLRAPTNGAGIEWHFIGPLQSNKAKLVAAHFDWVHGIERQKIADILSTTRHAMAMAPLNVCIQVNVSGEASKSGVAPNALHTLVAQVRDLPGLRLRGLMTIIENTEDELAQRVQFRTMHALFQQVAAGLNRESFDTLSMGMSQDFRVAIEEGSNMVRIGTAIFGERAGLGRAVQSKALASI